MAMPRGFWQIVPGSQGVQMERVLGIGGLFFRARDPAALSWWYDDCLGVDPVPQDCDGKVWTQRSGPTVFAPFEQTSDHFGDPGKVWMLNFRVRDLAAMVAPLQDRSVAVTVDPQVYPNGRFARLWQDQDNRAGS